MELFRKNSSRTVVCKQLQNSRFTYVYLRQSLKEMQIFSNFMVKQSFSFLHLQILMNVQDLILVGKAIV